ncbi:enhanced serine sensitivity protein SseB, partial [Empedobacter falsenii]|nr:enhanced serine sensitivity protein SseB [Empedobacter falsenii]
MSNYNRNKNTVAKLNTNLTLAQIIEQAGTNPEYRIVFYNRFLKDDI